MQAVSAGAPIVGGALSIFGGIKRRQALKQQAFAAEYEARSFDLRAQQSSGDRRAELRDSIAAISLARASSGLSLDSPTAQAVERAARSASASAEAREVLGERQSANAKRQEAKGLRKAGSMALISGIAGGIAGASGSSIFKPGV